MSVLPEIKSPLKEKIVVKPILWTMYHIHAYQGPCRYGQGYALTTECDMEVAKKEYDRFVERIQEAVDPAKTEVLEASLLFTRTFGKKPWLMMRRSISIWSADCAFPVILPWNWPAAPRKLLHLYPMKLLSLPAMTWT